MKLLKNVRLIYNMFYSHDSSNVKLNNKPFPLKSEFTRTLTEPVIMVIGK